MIKFFRKIRQNLLMENKTSKYFKYAVGEIVLVVIGILIALQINNWNENRKDKDYEVMMLSEISRTLEGDIKNFDIMIQRMNKLDSSVTVMAQHVVDKSKFIDSLYLYRDARRDYYLNLGITYQYNPGPYQALKSNSINKVSNDSLRNALIAFYDFSLPRLHELLRWSDKDYDAHNKELESFLGPVEILKHKDHHDYVSKYPEDLFLNPNFSKLLSKIDKRGRDIRGRLRTIKNRSQMMQDLLKAELQK